MDVVNLIYILLQRGKVFLCWFSDTSTCNMTSLYPFLYTYRPPCPVSIKSKKQDDFSSAFLDRMSDIFVESNRRLYFNQLKLMQLLIEQEKWNASEMHGIRQISITMFLFPSECTYQDIVLMTLLFWFILHFFHVSCFYYIHESSLDMLPILPIVLMGQNVRQHTIPLIWFGHLSK